MPDLRYNCYRCGKCCRGEDWLKRIISVADMARWKQEGRTDILSHVCNCRRLVDSETGEQWVEPDCPFLERNGDTTRCTIYETRPTACRNFPIRPCANESCPEKYHIHQWVWNGSCQAATEFRRDLVRTVERELDLLVESADGLPGDPEHPPADSASTEPESGDCAKEPTPSPASGPHG